MRTPASHDIRGLTGVIPPMITPFAEDDSIDRGQLRTETRFLLEAGVQGIVVGGSTGEGAGMSEEELYEAVSVVVGNHRRCGSGIGRRDRRHLRRSGATGGGGGASRSGGIAGPSAALSTL